MLWRERVEGDLILVRWALLAAATLHLLFSDTVTRPVPGWIGVVAGAVTNAVLVYYMQRSAISIVASAVTQLVDTVVLLLYLAALQGGLRGYLPVYTAMVALSTIRFGRWGAIASGVLGLILTVGIQFAATQAPSATPLPTASANVAAIVANAALLAYLAYLVHCQHLSHRERERELAKRVSEVTVLHDVSSAAHDLKSEDALQNIVEIVTRFMGFQRAALFLTEQVGEAIPHHYHSYRRASGHTRQPVLSMGQALFEAVLLRQQPIVIDGSQSSAEMSDEPALQIAVPLHSDEGPLGVLIADSNDRRSTSRSDMQMLSSLARSAVVAIENASLHRRVARMANHDGVTDLYNHRFFQERLREMLRVADSHWPLSLLMIEIDKFKRYNDTFGHRQGDTALYSLSRALERSTRTLDGTVARYGGDEFVVILPRVGLEDALHVAREIRDQAGDIVTELLSREGLPPVTLSIGVATYPDDAQSAPDLIEAADQAMYTVKHSGGNQVHAHSASQIHL